MNAKQADQFSSLWSLYPRRVGKGAAMKAYEKALKTASADEIIQGVRLQLPYYASLDPQFVPHLSTFLNQCRWLDEPQQPRQNNRKRTLADALIDRNRDSFDAYGSWGEREPGYAPLDLLGVRQRH